MDVLVLGGTSFVGRAIVEDLLSRGHTPTLFNPLPTGMTVDEDKAVLAETSPDWCNESYRVDPDAQERWAIARARGRARWRPDQADESAKRMRPGMRWWKP